MKQRVGNSRNEDGFTLFELLIVIIILAILAGIVAFSVGSSNANAASSSCQSDAKSFGTALEEYKAAVGAFPGATALQTTGSPLPGYGQVFGLTAGQQAHQLPGVYGILGNPSATAGSWTAPNGQTVGPFMRQLPGTQHYRIVTDGQGGVFIYPSTSSPNITASGMDFQTVAGVGGPSSDTSSLNFETDPGICSNTNVVS